MRLPLPRLFHPRLRHPLPRRGTPDGYASNHGDPDHWFRRFGKTMDDFRADVTRTLTPDSPFTAAVKKRFQLSDETMRYLQDYRFAQDLLKKLAELPDVPCALRPQGALFHSSLFTISTPPSGLRPATSPNACRRQGRLCSLRSAKALKWCGVSGRLIAAPTAIAGQRVR